MPLKMRHTRRGRGKTRISLLFHLQQALGESLFFVHNLIIIYNINLIYSIYYNLQKTQLFEHSNISGFVNLILSEFIGEDNFIILEFWFPFPFYFLRFVFLHIQLRNNTFCKRSTTTKTPRRCRYFARLAAPALSTFQP